MSRLCSRSATFPRSTVRCGSLWRTSEGGHHDRLRILRYAKSSSAKNLATQFGLLAITYKKRPPEMLDTCLNVKSEDGFAAVFESVMYSSWPGIFAAR